MSEQSLTYSASSIFDEALGAVNVELGVGGDDLGGLDVLEGGYLGAAGIPGAVFVLEGLEIVDTELRKMLEMVAQLGFFLLDGAYLVGDGLDVELGYLADRLLDQLQDIRVGNRAAEQVLVLEHGGLHVLELLLPGAGVVLEDLVDLVLEENLLEGGVVPLALDLVQTDGQFLAHQLPGPLGVVAEHVVHAHEVGLLVLDHTGVGRDADLTVGTGVEGVDGPVGGRVGV